MSCIRIECTRDSPLVLYVDTFPLQAPTANPQLTAYTLVVAHWVSMSWA